jgi:hypothetical protein
LRLIQGSIYWKIPCPSLGGGEISKGANGKENEGKGKERKKRGRKRD